MVTKKKFEVFIVNENDIDLNVNVESKEYGYCRVSTRHQKLARQLQALTDAGIPEENIYTDKMSGKSKENRDGLNTMLSILRPGDQVTCESISRMARSVQDLLWIMEKLDTMQVKCTFLKENISFEGPTGRLILHVLSAIAQFQRELIVLNTQEGVAIAREKGKVFGRPKTPDETVKRVLKLRDDKYSVKEILEMCNISSATYYRIIKAHSAV